MPKGPNGQNCAADVIGNELHFAGIATGEEQKTILQQPAKRNSRLAGAKARIENTTAEERQEAAQKAAAASWGL